MKLVVLFFFVTLLSSCSFYTITNKTNEDIVIKKSGGDTFILEALSCVELTEYFLGLEGDFPFSLEGADREYSANHYEVVLKLADEVATREVVLSNENTDCDKKKPLEEIKIDGKLKPVCGEGATPQVAKCSSSDGNAATAKCQIEGDDKKPICVNEKNEILSIKPKCEEESVQPICKEEKVSQESVKYYTITLKAEQAIVTIVIDDITKSLQAKNSCIKITRSHFSSLVMTAKSTASTGGLGKVLCSVVSKKCTPNNYDINTNNAPVSPELSLAPASSMNASAACELVQ